MFARIVTASFLSLGLLAGGALAQQSGSSGNQNSGDQSGNQTDSKNSGRQDDDRTDDPHQTGNCLGLTDRSAYRTSGGTAQSCN